MLYNYDSDDVRLAHPRFKLSHAIRHNGTFCRKYHMLTRKILLVNFVKNNSKVDPQMRWTFTNRGEEKNNLKTLL